MMNSSNQAAQSQIVETKKVEKVEKVDRIFNPAAIEAAINKASPLARSRLFKKMRKINWRAARWLPEDADVKSAAFGRVAGVYKQPLPSADLEKYIYNFVSVFAPEYVENGKVYE